MPEFISRRVDISQLCLQPHTYNGVDLKRVLEYAALPKETVPAIDTIWKDGKHQVANGHHRFAAALIRGDRDVLVSFFQ